MTTYTRAWGCQAADSDRVLTVGRLVVPAIIRLPMECSLPAFHSLAYGMSAQIIACRLTVLLLSRTGVQPQGPGIDHMYGMEAHPE